MTEMDHLWRRLKQRAATHAQCGYLISAREARRIVMALCGEGLKTPPTADAIDFLTAELVRMTAEAGELGEPRLRRRTYYGVT